MRNLTEITEDIMDILKQIDLEVSGTREKAELQEELAELHSERDYSELHL